MPRATYRHMGTGVLQEARHDEEEERIEVMNIEEEEHNSGVVVLEDMDTEENTDIFEDFNDQDNVLEGFGEEEDEALPSVNEENYDRENAFEQRTGCMSYKDGHEASEIWKFNKYSVDSLYYCNTCGRRTQQVRECACGGKVAKFIRAPMKEQMVNLVKCNFANIMSLREKLRKGEAGSHNLSAKFFRSRWESEANEELSLSLLGSIDGVCLKGHNKYSITSEIEEASSLICSAFKFSKKNKIWPISFELLDLPSAKMQKPDCLVLGGIIECAENPTTTLWNKVLKAVYLDVSNIKFEYSGFSINASISTFTADQPAKRALFGMRSHNSALSCFFCLDEGTFHKWMAEARSEFRPGDLTVYDAEMGYNGFSGIFPEILQHLMPYETPIDVLHDCGEGLLDQILKDLLPIQKKPSRKTDLFKCDTALLEAHLKIVAMRTDFRECYSRRNGSTKQEFFRSYVFESVLCTDFLSSKARMIIIGLSMIMIKMYAGSESGLEFYDNVCVSLQEFFRDDDHKYLTMKAHELLCHLPYATELFGNQALVSTFAFESFYKFILSDYNTCITNNFCETVATRFMTHASSRREFLRRWQLPNCSHRVRVFAAPHLLPKKIKYRSKVDRVVREDVVTFPSGLPVDHYAVLDHPAGQLISTYCDSATKDNIVFVKGGFGNMQCARFVTFVVCGAERRLLVQPVEEKLENERFKWLNVLALDFNGVTQMHSRRILRHLKEFRGVIHGTISNKRVLIPEESIQGVGVQFHFDSDHIFVQLNGLPVHA